MDNPNIPTERCITPECGNEVPDEGDTCTECQVTEAEFRREWDRYGRREYAQQQSYRTDMIEAGRAHLLPEGEREL